jgi:PadR family transcriptional regulator PadR
MQSWSAQLRRGVLELCILTTLRRGEAYGYQLLQQLRRIDGLAVSESSVYPILARLAGPPRRYYTLTLPGRRRFREMRDDYQRLHDGVRRLFEGEPS